MKRIIVSGLVVFGLAVLPWSSTSAGATNISDNAGTATAQFLKLEMGARHAAMGGTYAAHGSDVFSLWGQPASIVSSPDAWQVGFQHTEWFQGVTQEYGGFTVGLGPRVRVGMTVNTLGVDDLRRTTEDALGQLGSIGNTFGARDWGTSFHYGYALSENMHVGVTGRWISSAIDDVEAEGVAADLGVRWRLPAIEGLTVGASVTNLGRGLKYVAQRDDLPLTARLGVAYRIAPARLLLAADVVKSIDRDVDGGVGAEWRPIEAVRLRAGYRAAGRDLGQGLTAGIGFYFNGLELDYAYVPYGDLGDAHRVSASYLFGGGVMAPTEPASGPAANPSRGSANAQPGTSRVSASPSYQALPASTVPRTTYVPPAPLPPRILKNPR